MESWINGEGTLRVKSVLGVPSGSFRSWCVEGIGLVVAERLHRRQRHVCTGISIDSALGGR